MYNQLSSAKYNSPTSVQGGCYFVIKLAFIDRIIFLPFKHVSSFFYIYIYISEDNLSFEKHT